MVCQRHLVCTWHNTWTPKICHTGLGDAWNGHFLVFELFEVYAGKSRNLLCFENGSTLVGQFVSWSDEFQKISNGLNLSMVMPMQCQINGCIPLLQLIANQTQSDTQMWCYTGIYLLGISIWFTYMVTYGYTCIISAPVCSVLSFQPLHPLRCTLMLRSYIEHSMAVCLIKLTAFQCSHF